MKITITITMTMTTDRTVPVPASLNRNLLRNRNLPLAPLPPFGPSPSSDFVLPRRRRVTYNQGPGRDVPHSAERRSWKASASSCRFNDNSTNARFDQHYNAQVAVEQTSLLIVAATFMYRGGVAYRTFSYSRALFLLDFLLALASMGAVRMLLRGAQILVRRRGINLIPTLIVGRGPEAALCIHEMRARPELGYRVIGIVENERINTSASLTFEGVPVIGNLKNLPEAIRESGANEVIISDPNVPGEALFEVMIQTGRRRGVEFRIAPTLLNCLPSKTEIDQVGSLPMVTLFRSPLSSAARIVKRAADLIIATLALLILAPLWLLIALLIKLDSHGVVFYKQERVGMDGRVFLFYKFRTMHAGVDDSEHREFQRKYIKGQPDSNQGDGQRPAYKLRADQRVTRLGRVLRRTSLDELPQLFNVLRGDMSIVGPRPPIPYEVESYELWHRKRLDMKPGITGLWQVSGRNRLAFDEMVRMDLYYIENWSLLLDFKIILQTLPVMWRGEDAY